MAKKTPRYSKEKQSSMRADWESGMSMSMVARKHGCTATHVSNLRKREGWSRSDGCIPKPKPTGRPLSPQMEAFVAEYAKDFDARAAATRAGYKDSTSGNQLLRRPDVIAHINDALNTYHVKASHLKMRLLQEDINRVFFDPKELLDYSSAGVTLKPMQELPRKARMLIKNVKEVRHKDGTVTVEVELYDKDKSADRLYKHLGLLNDKIEHSVSTPLAELLAEIAARGPMPVRGGRAQEVGE